ncbi:hypothetical protein ACVIGB_008042 [Bradyrhizobium sp. USDA 4341]
MDRRFATIRYGGAADVPQRASDTTWASRSKWCYGAFLNSTSTACLAFAALARSCSANDSAYGNFLFLTENAKREWFVSNAIGMNPGSAGIESCCKRANAIQRRGPQAQTVRSGAKERAWHSGWVRERQRKFAAFLAAACGTGGGGQASRKAFAPHTAHLNFVTFTIQPNHQKAQRASSESRTGKLHQLRCLLLNCGKTDAIRPVCTPQLPSSHTRAPDSFLDGEGYGPIP